ncbi:RICIN domain-containing protein [Streptomyces sp. NBC_01443]|uniref:RICIN domain-containing protein n=1 Tax=Streptomyces sp. NBC_01443 TaxID=2903868 RepID=UPI00224F82FA|nr:RICIN domain-containing protein [Streptomyces sp. NBC_01443]MCX4626683.1 RICIN domain-containing protein [Streptomyces sp. NBC_01443]
MAQLGTAATETRTEAIAARVDDLVDWVRQIRITTASVQNANSNRCLYVGWRTPDNNAPALQADCAPEYADQLWKFEPVAGGGYQIRNTQQPLPRGVVAHPGVGRARHPDRL